MRAELQNMTDQPNDYCKNEHKYRNPVYAMHHCQVDITFGRRLAFAEYVYI
jgi:hypothetical protein